MRAGGYNMFFLLGIGLVLLVTAVRFARNADPQRLSIIRALTWTTVFSSLVGFVTGLTATCRYVIDHPESHENPVLDLLQGFSESCANLILGLSFLVITWALVAFGIRRMPHDTV